MKHTSKILLLAVLFSLLQSCGGIPEILSTPIQNIDSTPVKTSKLSENELKSWMNLDLVTDTVPGMSVNKAYAELLNGRSGVKVIVGIVESGVDIEHEDLASIIWINAKEIPNNGKDDDKNGYVDDIHGWNFLGESVHENLELTRIVKRNKTRFEGKTESQIVAADKADFADYQRAKKALDEKLKEMEAPKQQLDFIVTVDQTLKDYLKKTTYTKEDVEGINSADPKVLQSRNIMLQVLSNSTKEDFEKELAEFKEYISGQLDYNLNVNFDGRKVVGDDPYNYNDRNYGNNNVMGPEKKQIEHGTHVSGIIAAIRNNNIGMNGVANHVAIMPVRAVPDGDEYDKDIALGIRYAVDNGAKVINASFGKSFSPNKKWVYDAIKYAASKDVLIVHAAGNDNMFLDDPNSYNFPNDQEKGSPTEFADNMLTVGAIGYKYGSDIVARFSNYGKINVDVFAPGVKIWSTTPDNTYEYMQGTSMASPAAAGVAAIIRSYYPKLSAVQVKKIIMDSGLKINKVVVVPGGDDTKPFADLSKTGSIVNLYNAIILADRLSRGLK